MNLLQSFQGCGDADAVHGRAVSLDGSQLPSPKAINACDGLHCGVASLEGSCSEV